MPEPLKTVAFLQNMWVRDPDNLRRIYAEVAARGNVDVAKHRHCMITYCLFAGCLTGRRLKAAFGEALCQAIWWEQASTEITGTPSAKVTAEPAHIRSVLAAQQPDVVLCFGRIAADGVAASLADAPLDAPSWKGKIITGPHPAARGGYVLAALSQMRCELQAEIERRHTH